MAQVPIDNIVDVSVSLGGAQPIATASFNSAAFLADLTDVAFSDAYRIYESLTEVVADFATTTKTYKYAAKAFGGLFPIDKLYVIKYRTTGTVLTAVDALAATLTIDSTPYFISSDSRVEATVQALDVYCSSVDKLYITSSQAAAVLTTATTDIASLLQDTASNHTAIMYSAVSDTEMSEGGIVGAMAKIQPGVSTAEYKTLTGVAVDNLTTTQRTNVHAKNAMTYETASNVNCLFNTKVASGQWLDTIIFADWAKARTQEALFGLLKRESDAGRKVAFNAAGFTKVEQSIYEGMINVGLANGSITEARVRLPRPEDVSLANRANRVLPDIIVEILYSNGVHTASVNIYVSV